MTWWSDVPSVVKTLPLKARSSLIRVFARKDPSTLFAIKTSTTPDRLVAVLSDRNEDIVRENVSLAHVRVVASDFLLKEVMRCLQRLESHSSYFRAESAAALGKRAGIWQQITRGRASYFVRAEQCEESVHQLEQVAEVLHQFLGMHMEAVDDIHVALSSDRPNELARAIVASCRQASSFMHAVFQSNCSTELTTYVGDAVRSSIGASPRRDASDQVHAAGQLGQFWNQSSGSSAQQRLASHDVRLTLQILQRELVDLKRMSHHLRRVAEKNLGQPWDIQRRPLRYATYTGLALVTGRTAVVHSRYLGGTGLLEDKIVIYNEVFRGFIAQSVIEPLRKFYEQIFKHSPTSASEESVAITRAALRDMLVDFSERNLAGVAGADALARSGSMKAVLDLIKVEARHPLRNSFLGSLTQAVLLQVQKLKLDVEELMLKSKQMLRAQELNLALVALVPSLLTASALVYLIGNVSVYWRTRNLDMIVSSAQTARFLLSDVHRTVLVMESGRNVEQRSFESVMRHLRHVGVIHVKTCELEELVKLGLLRAPTKVLERFSGDLKLLRASGLTTESKRIHIDRMFSCYSFLQGA